MGLAKLLISLTEVTIGKLRMAGELQSRNRLRHC